MKKEAINISFSLQRVPKEFALLCKDEGNEFLQSILFSVYAVLPFVQEINVLRGEPKDSLWLPHIAQAFMSLTSKGPYGNTYAHDLYLSVATNASVVYALERLTDLQANSQPFLNGTLSPKISVPMAAFDTSSVIPVYLHLGSRETEGRWHFPERCATLNSYSAEEKLEALKLFPTRAQVENIISGD